MARMRLIDYLSHPEKLDEKSLESLKEALETYPFFQAGRMLWVKNLHQLDHIRYNNELKLSAAFIPDRSKLFFLVNDDFSSLSIPEQVETPQKEVVKQTQKTSSHQEEKDTRDTGGTTENSDWKENNDRAEADDSEARSEGVVGADANYFEVDDSVTTLAGKRVDFSLSKNWENEEVTEAEEDETAAEDSGLPSSGMLDYEKETISSAYSLEKEVAPEPTDFSQAHSFSEWLDLLKFQSADSSNVESKNTPEEKKKPGGMDLINNFLKSAGSQKRIVPQGPDATPNEDFSARSALESDDLMTETLADIHIKQKRYQKAVEIFERLRLKYPEKSVYFARRIKEMEDLINNQ
ncbi:tetratricopeptide repeat protein [Marinilabilia sp.]|uniref:tetratricopeptide repeat protein n=1 Tax=Marinilabilia sp. TaxID=2021252 RepID=UPI0025BF5E4E|nr:tetratricopeptide repeat protein [Marinilabilia sp.]